MGVGQEVPVAVLVGVLLAVMLGVTDMEGVGVGVLMKSFLQRLTFYKYYFKHRVNKLWYMKLHKVSLFRLDPP